MVKNRKKTKISLNTSRVYLNEGRIKARIVNRARKKGDIIFGARAIQKQIGLGARRTEDFDIFTKNSKQSAKEVETNIDKLTRGDNFFVKKGRNPGTFKVKWIGKDGIRGNADDKTVVDFTKFPKPLPKTKLINGVKYRTLEEEAKAKLRLVKKKQFAFRRAKDLEDLKRIMRFGRINRKS